LTCSRHRSRLERARWPGRGVRVPYDTAVTALLVAAELTPEPARTEGVTREWLFCKAAATPLAGVASLWRCKFAAAQVPGGGQSRRR
jgi:hypothetical protein